MSGDFSQRDASVIGVRLGNVGSARFKCEDSDLVLPASGGVYIHQSLIKGLNLREKRGGVGVSVTSESEENSWF